MPLPNETPPASRATRLQAHAEALIRRLRPWSWLWPPIAFAAGLGSFFLVERQRWLGAMLALGMLAAWLLLLSESLIGRLLARRGYPTLPHGATQFIAQMIHQETLFFCLPFLLATTVWSSGQALFTLLIIGMALFSIVDPLYYRVADRLRWLYFAFHAQCVFLVVLVTLPTLLHLTTYQSLLLAIAAMLLFSLPSLLHLTANQRGRRWLMVLTLLLPLAGAAWLGRIWVPPASLWIAATALSPSFDEAARAPSGELRLTPEALSRQGLFAYTAIHAPRGLREEIHHVWRQDGQEVDRIPLVIEGGREAGYRAWSHKQNFPESPAGRWRIDVMTEGGQRIGVIRFRVAEDESATLADGRPRRPAGLPGLAWQPPVPGESEGEQDVSQAATTEQPPATVEGGNESGDESGTDEDTDAAASGTARESE
ncbi:DUF5924 family protein [Halomonas sp. SSL-5]|uniref:DUF5924 family protein n=1 Tax=Halomonas sp. SSL-5 TaxID=3065855 RepID=UPI00273A0FE2|nr:DUF5924 family protein [Halomonas sp. SSL-5]MDY7116049.1 DUF5924 family protein [Halomonas sp. SSL-5]